ncbi:MAG: hypothetical protein MZW92_51105 [Comamonadaceae bacterium]|nr:hypothetical protein [Comamonadaceae bacterium]
MIPASPHRATSVPAAGSAPWPQRRHRPARTARPLGLGAAVAGAGAGPRRGCSRCACRAASWRACGPATRAIPCCARCCRWPTSSWRCPGSVPTRWATWRPRRRRACCTSTRAGRC